MAKRNTTKPEQTAAKPTKRKPIPDHIKEALLIEQGYKCGNPRCWTILNPAILEDHHIEYVSEGGGNEPSNLLALCPTCHTMHHHGMISRDAIRHWKKLIVALNHAVGQRSMDLLLFLHKLPSTEIRRIYTMDGVLQFAGLIAAGLVRMNDFAYSTMTGNVSSAHLVGLTEKGRLLIEAWLSGDAEKYRSVTETTAEK